MEAVGYSYVIKQLEAALRRRLTDVCTPAGFTAAQYTALSVLHARPGITSSELARRSFVRAQTMAATLDPLLERNYVRREQDRDHARRMALFLSDAGERVVATLAPEVERINETLVADLSPAERVAFGGYLHRVRRTLAAADEATIP